MRIVLSASLLLLLQGCNPYQNRSGEFFAGAVDPTAFPAQYLGTGGGPMAVGVFSQTQAFVKGQAIGYFGFTPPMSQSMAADPLLIATNNVSTAPLAYVFDPRPKTSPFPTTQKCQPPAGYVYSPRRDGWNRTEQGNVLTALPNADYMPVVAEVNVTSAGEPCQEIKSATGIVGRSDVKLETLPPAMTPNAKPTGKPDGNYLAWAAIDPGAEVDFLDGTTDAWTHLGPAKIGWYNHFLAVYIDGGYIPTMPPKPDPMDATQMIVDMVPQTLYYPNMMPVMGMNGPTTGPGKLGAGYDVLEAKRGQAGYSPLCHVRVFIPADPLNPENDVAAITPGQIVPEGDTPQYVWCLQVEGSK